MEPTYAEKTENAEGQDPLDLRNYAEISQRAVGHRLSRRNLVERRASIHWANPELPQDNVIIWLNAGATSDKERQLGFTG